MAIVSRSDGDEIRNPEGPVIIRHQRVRVYRDDSSVLDAGGAEFGIRGQDGCHEFRLEGLEVTGAGHGTRMTNAEGGAIIACKFHHCLGEGTQGGGLENLTVEGVHTHRNGWQGAEGRVGIPQHACHGAYFKGSGTIRGLDSHENDGCGLQLRGGPWVIEDSRIVDNLIGTGVGAPDVQVMAEDVELVRCLLSSLTIHSDGGDVGRNVVLTDSTVYGARRFALNVTRGCAPPQLVRSLMIGRVLAAAPQADVASQVLASDPGGLVGDDLGSLLAGAGWRPVA